MEVSYIVEMIGAKKLTRGAGQASKEGTTRYQNK